MREEGWGVILQREGDEGWMDGMEKREGVRGRWEGVGERVREGGME